MKIFTAQLEFEQMRSKDMVSLVCEYCDEVFNVAKKYIIRANSKPHRFCSVECRYSNQNKSADSLTLRELKDNYELSKYHNKIRTIFKSRNRHLNTGRCWNCSYDKCVEFCHIKPLKEFPLESFVKDVNSGDNLVILCPNCHWEFDNKILRLEDIKMRNK